MKYVTGISFALLLLLGVSASTAEAYDGVSGQGLRGGEGHGRIGLGMMGGRGEGLMTEEIREELRAQHEEECDALTIEEREEKRDEMRQFRNEQRTEFESFVGLTRDELRDVRLEGHSLGDVLNMNDVSEDDARDFLTEQAEERVTEMSERHNLTDEQTQTLLGRITSYVQNILDRWF